MKICHRLRQHSHEEAEHASAVNVDMGSFISPLFVLSFPPLFNPGQTLLDASFLHHKFIWPGTLILNGHRLSVFGQSLSPPH